MNRIFNVVWSKTKNCWIVVSEFVATGGGKSKKVRKRKNGVITASMAAALLLFNVGMIQAAYPFWPGYVGNTKYGTDSGSDVKGNYNTVVGNSSGNHIGIGWPASSSDYNSAFGNNSGNYVVGDSNTVSGNNSGKMGAVTK